jgi:hypothetical protein
MMPSNIIKELQELTQSNRQGVEALFEAESNLASKEYDLDRLESKAFLESQGTVADRQALARFEASDARFERDIAKAKVNRVRTKLKVIESELIATSTMSKLMQAEMRL